MKDLIKLITVILLGFVYDVLITLLFAFSVYTVWKYGMVNVFNYDLSYQSAFICSIFVIFIIECIKPDQLKIENNIDMNKEYVKTIIKMSSVFINRIIRISTAWLIAYLITKIFIYF